MSGRLGKNFSILLAGSLVLVLIYSQLHFIFSYCNRLEDVEEHIVAQFENGSYDVVHEETIRALKEENLQLKAQLAKLEQATSVKSVQSDSIVPKNNGTLSKEGRVRSELRAMSYDLEKGNVRYHSGESVCSSLPLSLPSVESLWYENLDAFFRKTQHRRDPDWEFKNFTSLLLDYIPPHVMKKSITSMPPHSAMRRVMKIIQKRRLYFDSANDGGNKAEAPPPLKVLVMGGSVTMVCEIIYLYIYCVPAQKLNIIGSNVSRKSSEF